MSWIDGLVALGVLGAFAFLIMAQLNKKNPMLLDRMKEWFGGGLYHRELPEIPSIPDKLEQVYDEKRALM